MDENNGLPDDLSQWPENYWEWFNLDSQNATYNDLRKAYSRLIKQFRPETHPQQFQKIQSAFELLRDLIQQKKSSPDGSKKNSDSSNDTTNELILNRQSKRQEKFLNTLYNKYINKADWDGAKSFLLNVIEPKQPLSDEQKQEISDLDEIPYLYMFWLMYTLTPPVENNLPELFKYLIMGDKAYHGDEMSVSSMTFFYFMERKELSYKNSIYEYAFNHLDFPAIGFLANIRWTNLRFEEDVDNVDVILSDLESFKKKLFQDNKKAWVSVNIQAIEHLHWINNDKAKCVIQDCMDEISKYPEYLLTFEKKLDYLDRIEELVASINKLPKILPVDIDAIHTLLFLSGNVVFSRCRRLVLKIAAELADDVLRAFLVFDYIQMHHPLVAIRLCYPFQQMFLTRHDKSDKLTDEQIDNIMTYMMQIWESHNQDFRASRLALLKYMLDEQFDPGEVSERFFNKLEIFSEKDSKKHDAQKLEKWLNSFLNDNSVTLTYYAIMCCEIEGMEDYDD